VYISLSLQIGCRLFDLWRDKIDICRVLLPPLPENLPWVTVRMVREHQEHDVGAITKQLSVYIYGDGYVQYIWIKEFLALLFLMRTLSPILGPLTSCMLASCYDHL
jgi:hypothetical protein